jgi:hypothetical protein
MPALVRLSILVMASSFLYLVGAMIFDYDHPEVHGPRAVAIMLICGAIAFAGLIFQN